MALTSCAHRPEIRYSGPITEQDVKPVIAAIKSGNPYSLRIRSLGGDGEAVTALAEAVQAFRIPVTIHNECASGCTLVYIASPKRKAEPGTALLFHWSGAFHAETLSQKLGAQNPEALKGSALAKRELSILSASGIDPQIYTDAVEIVRPLCASAQISNEELQYFGVSELNFVSFSHEALQSYGFKEKDIRNIITDPNTLKIRAESNNSWGGLVGFVPNRPKLSAKTNSTALRDCTREEFLALSRR